MTGYLVSCGLSVLVAIILAYLFGRASKENEIIEEVAKQNEAAVRVPSAIIRDSDSDVNRRVRSQAASQHMRPRVDSDK